MGKSGCLMYKILFDGYEDWNAAPPWQPYSDAAGCSQLVVDYHAQYSQKAGPHPAFETLDDWVPFLNALIFEAEASRHTAS
ncbi:hypothetical protein K402DRAFT_399272 [Aulographum hederae CBS 113979]|uniref:Uncharacterized protein n=1 Tax=Aulographum hederae CBS 113979 TaxID=1176131 RepID=A0A6G1GI21_9PEZI|nr:hypothetical protein K402DRAFT_399272 [Aulographum hederae CBS 113979]